MSEAKIVAKITRRLIPFLILLYVVSYLDRVNVSFAQLQMKSDLHFDSATYGFGAGIFCLGYFLFEIPSNLILERVGARRWIARIMVSWGLVAACMMFIRSPMSFYALRFLLGVAEAGFFPGVILYLTYWFTPAERARIVALFMTASALSIVLGGPVSGALLSLNGAGGLAGWKWLFLAEGLPAVILGFVVLRYLPAGPREAAWLSQEEKEVIAERLRRSNAGDSLPPIGSFRQAVFSPAVWLMGFIYFALNLGTYGLLMFMPLIIKGAGIADNFHVGLLCSIPPGCAVIAMVLFAAHSDATRERRRHLAFASLTASAGFLAGAHLHTTPSIVLAFSVVAAGMWAMQGPFWCLATGMLRGSSAAGGIALINSVGALGGFFGPFVLGAIEMRFHSYRYGLLTLGAGLLLGSAVALLLRDRPVSVLKPAPMPTD